MSDRNAPVSPLGKREIKGGSDPLPKTKEIKYAIQNFASAGK